MFHGFLNSVTNSRYLANTHLDLANVIPPVSSTQQVIFPLLPLISLGIAVNDLKNYCTTKDRSRLLSCIALFSAESVYCYKAVAFGSASSSILLVGLAISDGIKMIAAIHTAYSQWTSANPNKRRNLILDVLKQACYCFAWVAFAFGNPAGGFLLIAGAIVASIYLDCCSMINAPATAASIAPVAAAGSQHRQPPPRIMGIPDIRQDDPHGGAASRGQVYEVRGAAHNNENSGLPANNAPSGFIPFSGPGYRLGGS